MNFAGKLMYLIVRASNQLAVIIVNLQRFETDSLTFQWQGEKTKLKNLLPVIHG